MREQKERRKFPPKYVIQTDEAENIHRSRAKLAKELEGGNGATIGSGITHSPLGKQNVENVHTKSTKRKTLPDRG